MSQITLSKPHTACTEQLKLEAEALADKLKQKFGVKYHWENEYQMKLEGMDVQGQIFIEENNITVDVKLGLLAMLMKPKIERELHNYLNENISW